MKIFFSCILHESNSFSPIPTNIKSFQNWYLWLPEESSEIEGFNNVDFARIVNLCNRREHQIEFGPIAVAEPSGPLQQDTFVTLKQSLLRALRQAMPVDAVVLFLHGAQLAKSHDDCEGEILEDVRAIIEETVPIGVLLDLHCNVSKKMINNSTILMPCKEYPHTDFADRAKQLLTILENTKARKCLPTMAHVRVPMLGYFPTSCGPMRKLVHETTRYEARNGVLSVSLCHGFPYSDSFETGAGVIVTTDNNHESAQNLAHHFAKGFFSGRSAFGLATTTIEEALSVVEKKARSEEITKPFLIVDVCDNPGTGAPGDSTFILRYLLDHNIEGAAVAMIWDPIAAEVSSMAGPGARIPLRIGGKLSPYSGRALDVIATVKKVNYAAHQSGYGGKSRAKLGLSVTIECNGIEIVINSIRQQTYSPECFSELDIDPLSKQLLVIKSTHHFYRFFEDIAEEVLYCRTPGLATMNFEELPFRKIDRPIWPLDEVPFEVDGTKWS